jgi:hypothetical protein
MCFSGEIQPRCQPIVGTYHSLSATHIELAHQGDYVVREDLREDVIQLLSILPRCRLIDGFHSCQNDT